MGLQGVPPVILPGSPQHSFSDYPTVRSETLWSLLGAHSGSSEGHEVSGRGGDLAKTLEPSRTSCKPRAPGTWYWPLPKFYAENARSLLQTCFLLWAHSQCDRKLTLHASDYRGSRVQHEAWGAREVTSDCWDQRAWPSGLDLLRSQNHANSVA